MAQYSNWHYSGSIGVASSEMACSVAVLRGPCYAVSDETIFEPGPISSTQTPSGSFTYAKVSDSSPKGSTADSAPRLTKILYHFTVVNYETDVIKLAAVSIFLIKPAPLGVPIQFQSLIC